MEGRRGGGQAWLLPVTLPLLQQERLAWERGEKPATSPSLHWELLGTEMFMTSAHTGAALQPSEHWPPRPANKAWAS